MPPLVAYGSSDEEDNDETPQENIKSAAPPSTTNSKKAQPEAVASAPSPIAALPSQDVPPQGPALGPSMPLRQDYEPISGSNSEPQSPYTATRLLIRELTMPPVPDLIIPSSPPGPPPLAATEKFIRFLELKKQGKHFNAKLETSSALKNPNMLPALRKFAGIEENDTLATALPVDLAVPTSFPAWAYADQLNKMQQIVKKKREEEQAQKQREAIDFVPATASDAPSRAGIPGFSRAGYSSVSERVMAGLHREKPSTQDTGKRRDQRNGGQPEPKRSRFDERPR